MIQPEENPEDATAPALEIYSLEFQTAGQSAVHDRRAQVCAVVMQVCEKRGRTGEMTHRLA